jgi:hypothetical protein
MPSTIRVDTEFRSSRGRLGGAVDKALPNRESYLGFVLGLIATIVVMLAGLGWWLVKSGIVYIQINV